MLFPAEYAKNRSEAVSFLKDNFILNHSLRLFKVWWLLLIFSLICIVSL